MYTDNYYFTKKQGQFQTFAQREAKKSGGSEHRGPPPPKSARVGPTPNAPPLKPPLQKNNN